MNRYGSIFSSFTHQIKMVYAQFVHNLMGASLDLNAPTFQELNALNTSYPELHEEALTELHFSRSL